VCGGVVRICDHLYILKINALLKGIEIALINNRKRKTIGYKGLNSPIVYVRIGRLSGKFSRYNF